MCTCRGKKSDKRCLKCDPILASFTILYKPDCEMVTGEHMACIAECMAEHFTEIAAISDYQNYLHKRNY